jgi:hypothetical protein
VCVEFAEVEGFAFAAIVVKIICGGIIECSRGRRDDALNV